jgi:DNA-binding helix-hairpin-helix protein with protein kinase domain
VVVPPDHLQRVIGFTAIGAFAVCASCALCVRLGAVFVVISLLWAVVFGTWWLVLERLRRRQENEANQGRNSALAALQAEGKRRRAERNEAEQRVRKAERKRATAARRHSRSFDEKFAGLRALRDRHGSLQHEYTAERQQLLANARTMQLSLHLQQQFISDHDIPSIGPVRKAVLASYGIETAEDVTEQEVLQVPGFGPVLTGKLLDWRRKVERSFKFNAAAGVPPAMQQALDVKYRQARQQVEQQLRDGPRELQAITDRAAGELDQLVEQIRALVGQLAQTEADLDALPSPR